MKKYSVVIVTKYYKTIEFEAIDEDDAEDKAWELAENTDTLNGADAETDIYDLEEVTE
jgi:hypothetical protein